MARSIHAALFRWSPQAEVGNIDSAADFLRLINNGLDASNRPLLYNYVLSAYDDGKFRFTETGAQLGKDMVSKHAVLGNAEEDVYYAGDFFMMGQVLVLSNNSGTYAPSMDVAPLVQKVMEQNLKLEVLVIDHQDPRYKQWKEEYAVVTN
ncbi:hypothetical protein HK104_007695 [Borealophlyctis nickersoniae]|nr:hypothetical protein HK104_007695 [Borealophlyctis nickersoniae]